MKSNAFPSEEQKQHSPKRIHLVNVIPSDPFALQLLSVHPPNALLWADCISLATFCNVHLEMVRPVVSPAAHLTCKPAGGVVSPGVSLQLVWPHKLGPTARLWALVGSGSHVVPQVSF